MNASAAGATHVLIVDDDPFVRESLRDILEHAGYAALEAGDGKTALDLLSSEAIDLVLLDLELPRVSGMEVLRAIAERRLDVPLVIVSGKGSIATAVESMKLGAHDFIEKPLDARRTLETVRRVIEARARQLRRTRSLDEAMARYGICGASAPMQQVYAAIDRAAGSAAKVLLLGESGTGKEMVARAIHQLSPRRNRPFVDVNCAAIPETLIESELFGHSEGAFTGARRSHRGRLEQADGATLFLDEIGDMSLMTQAKVLRALETGELRRVGGEATIRSDFRVIAATHRDLRAEVGEGNFREDLFYRLSVITIHVPPLRDRREDVPDLVRHFMAMSTEGDGAAEMTPAALSLLTAFAWPGNVRQLRNVVERLCVFSDGRTIDAREVQQALSDDSPAGPPVAAPGLREARERFEREFIVSTLVAHAWRIQESADVLGINRSHLWKKMRQLDIEAPLGT